MTKPKKSYKVKFGEMVQGTKHKVDYIVAWPTDPATKAKLGSITIEMSTDVWGDDIRPPNRADFFVVTVREKPAGWYAETARYFQPDDLDDSNIVQ